ncbi:endoplasmic reticulum metallopeptidase 1 [Hippocampus comes]|uniref:Endoplasmic reticulum metallopeptidase 1 n=1 Tax=Hippocampus comes TaxID=109280 RepID=A0A3Q3DLX3_HIPCM|nr:PREDICTED: endoplasmic reticulum metallopeptidase 1 [Hippocampus comes]XP_019723558.1 PREDICTED: endoplasmic reticulum metallopeptidase 1 [Hippocampus comes]
MESDTTVRRIKPPFGTQSDVAPGHGSPGGRYGEDYNGWSGSGVSEPKRKPDVSLDLLREGPATSLVCVFILLLWALVHLSLQQLVIGKPSGEFNAERARQHLERIVNVGPRPVGSHENEVLTVDYLLEQIEKVRAMTEVGPHLQLSVDVQRPTGSFSIDFLGGFTSFYDRVTNIVVRLEPKGGSKHLMLANCHFDTVANSPGASDDAVSCAVMLEVLHSLANQSTPLRHGVIFLFNGAEENVLQASHGFITQHPWAKQVRAFINLEAAGVGGKEVVFQTGPENPWLVQAYVHAAKHPFASVVGQEVFQSGIIPSDTDFRIYRDFGNIPGIDLAFIENGFIYHTKYDTADRILTGSIQRAGDNILAVLKHLLMSEELADSSEYRHGNMVFFDVLGMVVVAYPARVGTILNYMVAVATFIYLARKASQPGNRGGRYVRNLACATVVALLGWLVAFLSVLIVAVLVTLLGRSMFWYTHFYASVCLYGSVATGKMVLVHTLAKNLYYRGVRMVELGDLYLDVSLLLWCCSLLWMTYRGLCSAYVPMLMVAFPLLTKLLLANEFKNRGASLKYSVLYLAGLALPYLHIMFLIWVVFEIFTPIMGRSGTEIPPEVVLAALVTIATVFLSSFFLHFIYLVRSTKWFLAGTGSVFTIVFLLVSSGLLFPYSGSPDRPRPKRVFLQHTTRTFYDVHGHVEARDSGVWINSFDYTGMQHVTPHVPQIHDGVRTNCREDRPFCGFPWFLPVKFLSKKNWYLPAPDVSPSSPVDFRLVSKEETGWGTVKMTFSVKGPSHMSLYLMPHPGASLSTWSFGDGTPQFDLSGEYFVFYSHGLDAPTWTFWFEIQPPRDRPPSASGPDGMISVAISTHYFFGEDQKTPRLEELLSRFPSWAFPSSWVSTYDLYRY